MKVSCHCGTVSVFDVKNVTLESISDSVFRLSYIFYVAPIAFQTVYKVIALASAISPVYCRFLYCYASFQCFILHTEKKKFFPTSVHLN